MKLTVIGKYGPFPRSGGGTSSYLLETRGAKVLLDAGESSFTRVSALIPPEKIDVFIITHFHHDHVCDLGVFSYYFERLSACGKLKKKPLLFCPADEGNIAAPFIGSEFFETVTVKDAFSSKAFGNEFSFYEMKHPALCYGVKINDGEKIFSYTGDTNLCDNIPPLAEKSDLIVADGCFLSDDWSEKKPHLSVRHCVDISRKYGVKTLVSHINPSYDEEKIRSEIPFGANCEIAEEGKSYEI